MGDFAIPLTWPGQQITVPEDMRDLTSGAEQVSGFVGNLARGKVVGGTLV